MTKRRKRDKVEPKATNGRHAVSDIDVTLKIATPKPRSPESGEPSDLELAEAADAEEELLTNTPTRHADELLEDAVRELNEEQPTRSVNGDVLRELDEDRETRMGADVLRALRSENELNAITDDESPFDARFDFSSGPESGVDLGGVAGGAGPEVPPDPGSADAASPRLQSIVESVLFAADRPLNLRQMADLVEEPDVERIRSAVLAIEQNWRERGVQLHEVAGGFQFRTHPSNASWVQRLLQQKPVRLSRQLLETLAIVSYRQPITRPEIDEIRGVDSGGTLKTLMDRSLVRILGKKEEVGRPLLYGTTKEFLEFFSLRDLKDLPTLREYHELSEEHQAQVAALADAAPAGSIIPDGGDVSDDEPTDSLPRLSRLEIAQPKEDAAELEEIDRLIRSAGASIATDSDLQGEVEAEQRIVTTKFSALRPQQDENAREFDEEERARTGTFGEPLPTVDEGATGGDFESEESTRLRGDGLDAELVDGRDPDKEPGT